MSSGTTKEVGTGIPNIGKRLRINEARKTIFPNKLLRPDLSVLRGVEQIPITLPRVIVRITRLRPPENHVSP